MQCPSCKQPMVLVIHQTATGPDGSQDRKQYRCRGCWHEEVVTAPRQTRDFTVRRRAA